MRRIPVYDILFHLSNMLPAPKMQLLLDKIGQLDIGWNERPLGERDLYELCDRFNLTVDELPLNTAAVIRKNTGFAGRQYRGRMFMPPTRISESDVSVAGVISGTSLSASNSTWNTFYFNLGTQNLLPVIIHGAPLSGPTPVPTPITSFSTTPLIGTIKRRIRP